MSSSTSSTALVAKSKVDTQLMPPPPPPKRIKRPPKVLDEDTYTEALSEIIARDFFPGLHETKCQQDYLDALESRDSDWIAEASRNLIAAQTPNFRRGTSLTTRSTVSTPRLGSETPGSTTSGNPTPSKPIVNTSLSLDAFQATYTSEDNASFNSLLDAQNAKLRTSHPWLFSSNKLPSKQQLAQHKLLSTNPSKALLEASKAEKDPRKALPETWKFNPHNSLMFPPSTTSPPPEEKTTKDASGRDQLLPPKSILHSNTRLPVLPDPSPSVPASPSLSAIHDAISGNPRRSASSLAGGSETPRVRGYSYIPSPSPSDLSTSTPFRIAATPRREVLHQKMVDKVAKTKRLNKAASTPSISTPGRPGRTPAMTPAGARLWSSMTGKAGGFGDAFGGGLTPRAGGKGMVTPRFRRVGGETPRK
ncbi:hypothetical protein BJ508DRAFT_211897 [Ascobolus immersus RN42]|uniref:Nuclear protein DGCR14 n=1 Tax=Ascobolus immersus RN42 TaxID=1160509 RepID=A0A3N4IAD6_ASCIM|nr:hypothetical protein BJ508DRAFT_211897 [Ascobolus immersus RN42]